MLPPGKLTHVALGVLTRDNAASSPDVRYIARLAGRLRVHMVTIPSVGPSAGQARYPHASPIHGPTEGNANADWPARPDDNGQI